MNAIDRDSALYRRYMEQFDKQETRLIELLEESERVWTAVQAAADDTENYIANLEITED
jgi:hypothetical protein